jgi:hypothetical protein
MKNKKQKINMANTCSTVSCVPCLIDQVAIFDFPKFGLLADELLVSVFGVRQSYLLKIKHFCMSYFFFFFDTTSEI